MEPHAMVRRAQAALSEPEVISMVKRLSDYGLGVFMPHLHTDEGFAPLPSSVVQLETDLKVHFVPRDDPLVAGAAPVGWVWDEKGAAVASACYCTGAQHNPHWDRPKPKA